MPSIRHPSPKKTYVKWSMGLISSLLNFAARIFSAIAIPTPLAIPWPRGPVVVSMPELISYSGWPGVFDFRTLKSLISSIEIG